MSSKPQSRKVNFNVSELYEVIDVIGEGAYGVVWYVLFITQGQFLSVSLLTWTSSALHRPSGQKVAIKKITPFDHSMFCLRTLREMKLLRYFNHENVGTLSSSTWKKHELTRLVDNFNSGYTEAERL